MISFPFSTSSWFSTCLLLGPIFSEHHCYCFWLILVIAEAKMIEEMSVAMSPLKMTWPFIMCKSHRLNISVSFARMILNDDFVVHALPLGSWSSGWFFVVVEFAGFYYWTCFKYIMLFCIRELVLAISKGHS